jgi:hypothetical protein
MATTTEDSQLTTVKAPWQNAAAAPPTPPWETSWAPTPPFPGAVALFVEVAGDACEGKILDQQFHHLHKDLVLFRIDLQPQTVLRDAKAVRDIFDPAFNRSVTG